MILVDTSVWIDIFRDRRKGDLFRQKARGRDLVLCRFTQLELLQGARDVREWAVLADYLDTQTYLEMKNDSWARAAKLYFDLRRRAFTIRSTIDCCIAQIAIEHDVPLLHRDRDFQKIARIVSLDEEWVKW
ncbi:MAG: PIN domain-containing protein [Acidobacteria bacterium]|nr:PIN domain-containing protein [Acidobacteriota bacterium]